MKRHIALKRFAVVLSAIICLLAIVWLSLSFKMNSDIKNLKFYEIDMSLLRDGIYKGKAETALVEAEVEVEIKDHRIVRIDILKHDNGLGKKAERLTEDMIRLNTYDVDAVSGATYSSEVIKSAVSAALAGEVGN